MCDLCPPERARHCDTAQGLKQHQLLVHGIKCPIRPYVVSARCPACSLDYGTRLRALRHARNNSVRCRAKILSGVCPLPDEELLKAADLADRGAVKAALRAGTTPGKALTPGPKAGPKRPG